MGRVYPRASFKKNLKRYNDTQVKGNADVLMYLVYLEYLEKMVKNASEAAQKVDGSATIRPRDVEKASKEIMKQFKG